MRWVVTTSRSPTFVVATEQECGKRGMPTTQFSRSFTFTRRKVPALCGMSGSIELKIPVMQLFIAHVRDSLTPAGRQSMLSVRSASIIPASGSIVIDTRIGIPSGAGPNGSCMPSPTIVPAGIFEITCAIATLGVVEPLLDELRERLRPVLRAELLQARLADPGGAEHRQVVAVPLVGHPDPAAAHADHVVDVAVVALHAHRREDQAALLVDVPRIRHVGRRLRVAAVGLVRLRAQP